MPELSDENKLRLKEILALLTPEQIRILAVFLTCLPSNQREAHEAIEGILEVSAISEELRTVSAVSPQLVEISRHSPDLSEMVEGYRRRKRNWADLMGVLAAIAKIGAVIAMLYGAGSFLWPEAVPLEVPAIEAPLSE